MKAGWIDRASGDFAKLLRAPDLRLVDLAWDCVEYDGPFVQDFVDTKRAYFYHVLDGAAYFRTGPGEAELHYVAAGTTVGVEGHAHQWLDASHLHASALRNAENGKMGKEQFPFRLIVSSVDRSSAVLQRLPNGAILIPEDAQPYAGMIKGCVELMQFHLLGRDVDTSVMRRLSEIIMLQLFRFSRSQLFVGRETHNVLLHDEFILRAMSAFFARPGADWTVARLAEQAGLSRSAFSERFTRAFGSSVLKTINHFRLQQAAEMLMASNASLSTIASEVGFGSAPPFVRAFKKQFGVTPGMWRQQSRKSVEQPVTVMGHVLDGMDSRHRFARLVANPPILEISNETKSKQRAARDTGLK